MEFIERPWKVIDNDSQSLKIQGHAVQSHGKSYEGNRKGNESASDISEKQHCENDTRAQLGYMYPSKDFSARTLRDEIPSHILLE